ncbi:anti-sigma factor [Bacteroidia bacterium]|nr:anti-sigma factor [Bacteroidia bacterium]
MGKKDNNDRIHSLILAYLANTCTPEEKKELSGFIAVMEDEELFLSIEKVWQDYKPKTAMPKEKALTMLSNILSNNTQPIKHKSGNKRLLLRSLSIAASIAALVVFSFLIRPKANHQETQSVWVEAVEVGTDIPTDYIRNITLPDGSSIILQAKSTIRYMSDFSGNTREISLEGQAFFDITPDPEKPFIIHTGLIKTTVLGTAFNIKALPSEKEVTVSVTKGKVRVENDNKVLAALTMNQELHYKQEDREIKHTPVLIEKVVTDWTKQDMEFDHVPLKDVAGILSKRYGVSIEIVGLELADSEIVSSFDGTESLEDILKVLCAINSRTRFVTENKNIIISNK